MGYAVELGSDPVTAIQGVTSRAARVCRLEDRIGKLENGMEADIIAVEGNPLEDVSRLSQVGLVMKGLSLIHIFLIRFLKSVYGS